jgi:pimeloyl-ACP methyl ester carboxylesterase
MRLLVGDVAAVIKHLGREKAIIVGHDWGGAISWQFAFHGPQMVEKLVILNLPHPARPLPRTRHQPQAAGSLGLRAHLPAPRFPQAPHRGAPRLLGHRRRCPRQVPRSLQRSSFDAMMNYYRRNYPKRALRSPHRPAASLTVPVLMIHGLNDKALLIRPPLTTPGNGSTPT